MNLFASSQAGDVLLMLFMFGCAGLFVVGWLVYASVMRVVTGKWPETPAERKARERNGNPTNEP